MYLKLGSAYALLAKIKGNLEIVGRILFLKRRKF